MKKYTRPQPLPNSDHPCETWVPRFNRTCNSRASQFCYPIEEETTGLKTQIKKCRRHMGLLQMNQYTA